MAKQEVQKRQERQPQESEQQQAPAVGERTRPRPVYIPRTDIYETDTGWLNYDSNGSAAGGAVHFATLSPNLPLASWDFAVI